MTKAERAKTVQKILNKIYPKTPIPLNHKNVFELLIAVLLSAQCTDERVNKSKGDSRPYNTLKERVAMLESLKYIDEVVAFSEDSELETCVLQSDATIMVIGSDYRGKRVIGAQYVDEIKFFDRLGEYSTTKTLESL